MARRKKKQEEHENHERWLVSYADFITLLFAFFVVMYSISSVNEGKYRVLSDALTAAFRNPMKTMRPIQVGSKSTSPVQVQFRLDNQANIVESFDLPLPVRQPKNLSGDQAGGGPVVQKIAEDIEVAMEELIKRDLIDIRRDEDWLEVEITTSILFPSGSATLSKEAEPVLRRLAEILRPFPNSIHVEGFTDNVPINTVEFPSNWELSAARAASVVHLFMDYDIDPGRMAAIGYGEYQPISGNDTEEGRRRNRRVVLVVMESGDTRRPWAPEGMPEGETAAAAEPQGGKT